MVRDSCASYIFQLTALHFSVSGATCVYSVCIFFHLYGNAHSYQLCRMSGTLNASHQAKVALLPRQHRPRRQPLKLQQQPAAVVALRHLVLLPLSHNLP
jgi:hypothetical protein